MIPHWADAQCSVAFKTHLTKVVTMETLTLIRVSSSKPSSAECHSGSMTFAAQGIMQVKIEIINPAYLLKHQREELVTT